MRNHSLLVYMVLVILMSGVFTAYAFGEQSTETVVKESNPAYDNITWQDVNNKREEREHDNFFTHMYYTLFKHHKETTYEGEEIDVVQTAGNVDFEDNNSPISFVHVTSDQ
jgi:hypothetical protein